MNVEKQKAYLLLQNGIMLEGKSMGQQGETIGEIVFTTGMTAYQEALTDPSYYGQMLVQTFPLIGNYGTNSEDFESEKAHLNGYIVREYCELPSNFRCEKNINSFLKENNIVGICDIDTRRLTRLLRDNGTMNGMITTNEIVDKESAIKKISEFRITDSIKNTSNSKKTLLKALTEKKHDIVLFDFGHKNNIINEFRNRGCDITLVPYNTTAEEIKAIAPDGILLSNGAGDPFENTEIITNLKEIIKLHIPIFGISLGHQLLALAAGAKTAKLKHGHRGANQPVFDHDLNRTFITSQNHGYEVLADTLDKNVGKVSFENANDHSCEGIVYENIPAITVQFHPETNGGPQDTSYLYDRFLNKLCK